MSGGAYRGHDVVSRIHLLCMAAAVAMRLQNLSFDDWLEHAFGREVRFQQAPWYFDPEHDWWDPPAADAVSYLTRLFEDPEPALQGFADSQIAQGLTYLVNTSAGGDSRWLCSTDVPVEDRVRCVTSVAALFTKLFEPRCDPSLSHLSEAASNALNGVCYMWWDAFPSLALPGDPDLPTLHDCALQTMDRILQLKSIACQESALHGLGHWRRDYRDKVSQIIDCFCEAHAGIDPRLSAYAQSARCGCVL
ncbi:MULTISPECIES: hypothetical protein [unclassified Bradyrhizobium]|uniref:hypothetical protein n=1 Tax=unclassified Bradyrhizobium TaxID=2631580 RepID=UPI001CD5D29B|nr:MULTISPECIES: hypothetical protein [unclassified Bradyrhizobium]